MPKKDGFMFSSLSTVVLFVGHGLQVESFKKQLPVVATKIGNGSMMFHAPKICTYTILPGPSRGDNRIRDGELTHWFHGTRVA